MTSTKYSPNRALKPTLLNMPLQFVDSLFTFKAFTNNQFLLFYGHDKEDLPRRKLLRRVPTGEMSVAMQFCLPPTPFAMQLSLH